MPAKDGKLNVYEIITEQFLSALDKGIVPWKKPWVSRNERHTNLKSKKAYRGVNQMLLDISAMTAGYSSPYWVSFKQAKDMGGSVKKGEKSTLVTFWKIIEDKADPTKKIPLLRYYRVFNVEQCEGIEDKIPAASTEKREHTPIEEAEAIWQGMKDAPGLTFGGDRACYSPLSDKVSMPYAEDFVGDEAYYATLFHEIVHSTGHETRLKREFGPRFGDEKYSKEELIAEFGAAFLCNEAGILAATFDNSVAYIQNWKSKLSAEPKWVVQAAGQAQKAADYILGIKWDNDKEEEAE